MARRILAVLLCVASVPQFADVRAAAEDCGTTTCVSEKVGASVHCTKRSARTFVCKGRSTFTLRARNQDDTAVGGWMASHLVLQRCVGSGCTQLSDRRDDCGWDALEPGCSLSLTMAKRQVVRVRAGRCLSYTLFWRAEVSVGPAGAAPLHFSEHEIAPSISDHQVLCARS